MRNSDCGQTGDSALAAAVRALPVRSAIIDGEGVICCPDWLIDF
jgi:hypothetical protein